MTHVATLISNPQRPALDDAILAKAVAVLPGAAQPRWLDPAIAADIPFSPKSANHPRVLNDLRSTLGGRPVDVIAQPAAHRRKRLIVADMDSTMIGQECIDELADRAGVRTKVAAITERAMRGEIAFAPALRERVALLAGLDRGIVEDVIASRIRITPGGPALIATMRAAGAYACLVSGGFTLFTDPIAAAIGFDDSRANRLVVENGRLTGVVEEPVLGPEAKLATLLELTARLQLTVFDTLAVGDGANDLAMLQAAGLGVAYQAKPAVAAKIDARIEHGDLTALLYLQGFRRDEFVTR
ncbi:MAG TPA: phosphoserine phosphatase SerB [Xanthobacteraceae bacterium]|nr:phosphoserine phosphatase SerB [Xanthobacteraceae bacterium]